MSEGNAADRQAAQQAQEQEKRHEDESERSTGADGASGTDDAGDDDSAVAVSPDTQRSDPEQGIDDSPFARDAERGRSAVFADEEDVEPRAAGHADEDRA